MVGSIVLGSITTSDTGVVIDINGTALAELIGGRALVLNIRAMSSTKVRWTPAQPRDPYGSGSKIDLIKWIRVFTGLGLAEAKDMVDASVPFGTNGPGPYVIDIGRPITCALPAYLELV